MGLAIKKDTCDLIEKIAAREARPPESIVDDAMRLYEALHSDAYKQYVDLARRFRNAPEGSDEREIAADELARDSAREKGLKVSD